MKKLLISLAAMLTLPLLGNAQETLRIGDKTYNVADVEEITIANTRPTVADVLARHTEYSIFSEALEATGLADTLSIRNKFRVYEVSNHLWAGSTPYDSPTECKVKFTLFAVDNETFRTIGITDFASLKEKCIEWYGNAGWYNYPGMDKLSISTGDDYTYTYNVVNMFVRYHILKAGMKYKKLVRCYDPEDNNWNFAFGGEPHSYYETLLPNTIVKIWQPLYHNTGDSQNIWVNRYRMNNTLTNQVGTMGSEAMHPLMDEGALVRKEKSDIYALNGYIHNVSKPLIYNLDAAYGVFYERMRIGINDILHELANNDLRFAKQNEVDWLSSTNNNSFGSVCAIMPNDYFDNLKTNTERTSIAVFSSWTWRLWNNEYFGLSNNADVCLRLPSVPTGRYEIRLGYPIQITGGKIQLYLGTTNDPEKMYEFGDVFDTRFPDISIKEDRDSIGYKLLEEYDDYGVASDMEMQTHGYMRAPASYAYGTYNTIKQPVGSADELIANPKNSCRYEEGHNIMTIRKAVGMTYLEQQNDYWLRIKVIGNDNPDARRALDYIELVPEGIVNNTNYTEDWY
ncbi:MAG: hypothetical protein Q4D28_00670 [Prevotellaceae bacterium]|nr:hypothetical protein [Prevotellaceae bacterium]